jgi:hypothetical protein
MSISFQGIGEMYATFLASDTVQADQVVKLTDRETVGPCSDSGEFCGVAVCGRDGAWSVQVEGFVTVGYSGTVPGVGYQALSANGKGGVKSDNGGRSYLVVDADTTGKTVTIKL